MKKILIIVLVITLSLNMVFIPQKVEASGVAITAKLLEFLIIAATTGVTFNAISEAEAILSDYENNNPRPPNLPDPAIVGIAFLADSLSKLEEQYGDDIKNMFTSVRDYFANYIIEADNNQPIRKEYMTYSPNSLIIEPGKYYSAVSSGNKWSVREFTWTRKTVPTTNGNGIGYRHTVSSSTETKTVSDMHGIGRRCLYVTSYTIFGPSTIDGNKTQNTVAIDIPIIEVYKDTGVLPSDYSIGEVNSKPNTPVLTGEAPTKILKPNIKGTSKYQETINDNGTKSAKYDGTIEELLNELLNNFDLDTLKNPGDYELTETETGTDINTGPEDSPYPSPEEGTDTGLFQSMINWLKLIWEAITGIFVPNEPPTLDFSKLKMNNFQLKFPFSIPWDLYNSISVFAQSASEPQLIIDLDTEYFDVYHEIDLTQINFPITFFRYSAIIFFIYFLILKTRDLIKW